MKDFSTVVLYCVLFPAAFLCATCNGTGLMTYLAADDDTVCNPTNCVMLGVLTVYLVVLGESVHEYIVDDLFMNK